MLDWIARLSGREQAILIIAFVVLLGIGLHGGLIEPYRLKQTALQDELEQRQADLSWMQTAVLQLRPASATASTQKIQGSLVNYLDRQVRQVGLTESLAQMSPLNDGEVRLRFRSADFAAYLRLIAQISDAGLSIKDVQVTAIDNAPGQINTNLILVRP